MLSSRLQWAWTQRGRSWCGADLRPASSPALCSARFWLRSSPAWASRSWLSSGCDSRAGMRSGPPSLSEWHQWTLNTCTAASHHVLQVLRLTWITSLCLQVPVTCPAPISPRARTQQALTTPKTSETTRTPVSSMSHLSNIWLLPLFSPKENPSDSQATRTVRPSLQFFLSVFTD